MQTNYIFRKRNIDYLACRMKKWKRLAISMPSEYLKLKTIIKATNRMHLHIEKPFTPYIWTFKNKNLFFHVFVGRLKEYIQ